MIVFYNALLRYQANEIPIVHSSFRYKICSWYNEYLIFHFFVTMSISTESNATKTSSSVIDTMHNGRTSCQYVNICLICVHVHIYNLSLNAWKLRGKDVGEGGRNILIRQGFLIKDTKKI